jgi:hypothetical protein
MSESNDTSLALQALNNAKSARGRSDGRSDGLLHHSDRGSPYGSDLYTDRLCALHMQPSMSKKGDCWDNAVAESFFSTLEWELLRKRSFATHSQARRIVSEYIDQFFNPIRRHSTNGCFSPIEFELRWQSRQLMVLSTCPRNAGKLTREAVLIMERCNVIARRGSRSAMRCNSPLRRRNPHASTRTRRFLAAGWCSSELRWSVCIASRRRGRCSGCRSVQRPCTQVRRCIL